MKPRIVGKTGKQKTKVFIEVFIIQHLGNLIKLHIGYLKEEQLGL